MKLMCPHCRCSGLFIIQAEVKVTVAGLDCLPELHTTDISDLSYGDSSMCSCNTCGHCGELQTFLMLPANSTALDMLLQDVMQTGASPSGNVYPLPLPSKRDQ